MPNKELPNRDVLLEAMAFCPLSGRAYWKRRPESHFPKGWSGTWNKRYPGKQAGTVSAQGYLRCAIDKSVFPIHRLMWYVHNGPIPEHLEIDHINGDRSDNRLSNLRLATRQQNGMNKGLSPRNRSGNTGVHWHEKRRRWLAVIRKDGRLRHIGYYIDYASACEAREKAASQLFGEYKRN